MLSDLLRSGRPVVALPPRRDEHSRTPQYTSGAKGVVRGYFGRHVLPASAARRERPVAEDDLYSVEYQATALFGTGDHIVHVDLYRSSLEAPR